MTIGLDRNTLITIHLEYLLPNDEREKERLGKFSPNGATLLTQVVL